MVKYSVPGWGTKIQADRYTPRRFLEPEKLAEKRAKSRAYRERLKAEGRIKLVGRKKLTDEEKKARAEKRRLDERLLKESEKTYAEWLNEQKALGKFKGG